MTSKAEKKMGMNDPVQQPNGFQLMLRVNLLLWGLLALAGLGFFLALGAVWDRALQGLLAYLALVLGGGFTLVSVMDYIYGTSARTDHE